MTHCGEGFGALEGFHNLKPERYRIAGTSSGYDAAVSNNSFRYKNRTFGNGSALKSVKTGEFLSLQTIELA